MATRVPLEELDGCQYRWDAVKRSRGKGGAGYAELSFALGEVENEAPMVDSNRRFEARASLVRG